MQPQFSHGSSRRVDYHPGGRGDRRRHSSGAGYNSGYNRRGRDSGIYSRGPGQNDHRRPRYSNGSDGGQRRSSFGRRPVSIFKQMQDEIPQSVATAKQIITLLGDFSQMTEDDDIPSNIQALSALLISQGDLVTYEREISDIFVKGFTQLSVQSPILATLLAMIQKQDTASAFPGVVVSRLCAATLLAIEKDDVMQAKIALRSIACLAASNCVQVDGAGGVCAVLEALVQAVNNGLTSGNSANGLSHAGQVAAYLLASTIPWIVNTLATSGQTGASALNHSREVLTRVYTDWSSPFSVGGQQAIFHVNVLHSTDDMSAESGGVCVPGLTPKGPRGSTCWDSLYEIAKIAVDVINEADAKVSSGRVEELSTVPACVCMCCPWQSQALRELLFASTDSSSALPLGETFAADILAMATSGKMGSSSKYCLPQGSPIGISTASWLTPRFPVYEAESAPDSARCADLTQLEKFTLMDYYRDILHFFEPYLLEDGTRVGSIELTITHLLAVAKLAPGGGRDEQLRLEYLLLEVMFQSIVRQPANQSLTSGHFRLILELAKKMPTFGPAAALGMALLYNLLAEMDTSAAHELSRWLSFHLLNTQLSWPYWAHWAAEYAQGVSVSAEGGAGNVKLFCGSVIDHCARNALPGRVRPTIPEAFHEFLPADATLKCPLFETENNTSNEMAVAMDGTADNTEGGNSNGNTLKTYNPNDLKSVAGRLKEFLVKREDAETVEEWLEALDQNELAGQLTAGGYSADAWRAQLLLQGILAVAGTTISTVAGLADRYTSPLRSLAAPASASASNDTNTNAGAIAVMSSLVEAIGHEPGYLNIVLDLLLRRGIVDPIAAADWATSPPALEGLVNSYWSHQHVQVVVDRAIDIARAAVAHRRELGGDMRLDETATLSLLTNNSNSDDAIQRTSRRITRPAMAPDEPVEVDNGEGDNGDGGDEEAPKRRRNGDGDDGGEGDAAMDMTDGTGAGAGEEEDDPVNVATEAVLYALHNVRAVYATVIGRLLVALARREQQLADVKASGGGDDESGTDEWTVAARSLLLQALRSFHGAEAAYLAPVTDTNTDSGAGDATMEGMGTGGAAEQGQEQGRVVLTVIGEVESALARAQSEGLFENSGKSEAVAMWRKVTVTAGNRS